MSSAKRHGFVVPFIMAIENQYILYSVLMYSKMWKGFICHYFLFLFKCYDAQQITCYMISTDIPIIIPLMRSLLNELISIRPIFHLNITQRNTHFISTTFCNHFSFQFAKNLYLFTNVELFRLLYNAFFFTAFFFTNSQLCTENMKKQGD